MKYDANDIQTNMNHANRHFMGDLCMRAHCPLPAGEPLDATYAETSSTYSTKQVIGYFWPVDLLKKHDKPLPKKLQVISHQGQKLKGVTRDEFVVGA